MNENADKHLDNLSRKVIGKSAVESTSLDFTTSVMSQINALNSSSVTTYVPLISKTVWILIILVFAGVVGYVSFGTSEEKNSWLSNLDYEFVNPLTTLELSQTVVYSVLLFAIMICIQIPLLKHHFNKRYQA
jgi:hypothetical protein